jgi:RND superfamily putative drug exporter
MSSFLYRVGRASFRARRRVVAAWLLVLVLLGALAFAVGGKYDDSFKIPNAASTIALDQLKATFPEAADATATVLVTVPEGSKLEDPKVKTAVEDWLKKFEKLNFVRGTVSPYNEHVDGLISDDGRSGRVTVRVNTTASLITDAQREQITEVADSLAEQLPGTKALAGGEIFGIHVPHLSIVEALGLGVAVLVLLVTLGSFVASMMPIGSAVTGVGIAVLITQTAAGVISVSSTTLMLAIMLGLAVGIDYALFILSRHRDQLATGMDVEESAARAVGTAGSAVVFAGLTVIIALVGLSIAGLPFLAVMGIFAAVGVAVEVLLALTMLPAFLGFAGERMRPKAPKPKKATRPRRSLNIAGGWVRLVTKWPLVTVAIVLIALGALAIPTKDLYLALPTSSRSLPGTQDRIAADEITKIFGAGANGPLIVTANIVESDDPMEIMDGLKADIEAIPGVKMVATSTPNENADTGMVQVIPTTGPDDPATAELVQHLRDHQAEWKSEWGVDTAVTGFTAVTIDVTERLQEALLPFGIFVVGLSLVLLTMVFRSLWVPIKAALGYLLSLGGAFGATTLVFNEGWLKEAINLPEAGPVISFLPIIVMGILFGLAMDYEVFLVSRMREEYVHGNTTTWVEDGFVHSAKVVAAAGAIMFAVFAFFVPNGEGAIKPIAFALAVGVLLDAFVVRMTLVPAVMKLLGRHAWWLPPWLDRRLPSFDIEGESLTRQLQLADWPAPGDTSAVVAEGLAARLGDRVIFDAVTLRVEPGEVLVIEAEPAQRKALLMALSGRLKLTEGRAKVLGLVLPEEAPVLRPRAAMLSAGTADFERLLKRQHGGLVCVDSADELSQRRDALLAQTLTTSAASAEPITWLLGVAPGAELDGWLPVPYRVLRLASHRALEGASK